jgi:hypothetical protein
LGRVVGHDGHERWRGTVGSLGAVARAWAGGSRRGCGQFTGEAGQARELGLGEWDAVEHVGPATLGDQLFEEGKEHLHLGHGRDDEVGGVAGPVADLKTGELYGLLYFS